MKKSKAFAEPIILLSFTGNYGTFFTNLTLTEFILFSPTRWEMKVCYQSIMK